MKRAVKGFEESTEKEEKDMQVDRILNSSGQHLMAITAGMPPHRPNA